MPHSSTGALIGCQHQHVPFVEADQVHRGIEERAVLAVPDGVVDDQEGDRVAVTVGGRSYRG